ncbi:MAG: SDR family oxidoreductase [Prolixibacteraceae bacterium]|jgi:NAD(P)-dependent dehydrogenase (short-subunit alcohol dehydrogenase family)|nr:SDR family oxidoreductase [Prolixibacteraceae bacterium]
MKKVILITGISSGFGKEMARVLVEKGHVVYGTIRSDCDVARGVKTVYMELSDTESIDKAVSHIFKEEGRIDVLINNAGMHSGGPVEDSPESIFRKQMDINFHGWVNTIKKVVPHMRKQKSGLIINISSIGALTGLPFQGVYTSAKFAIEGLSYALRLELKQFNISVVVVNPGDFKTRNVETREISIVESSVYEKQFRKSLAIIEKEEGNGKDPEILAKKIAKIVEKKNPKYRYLVGSFIQKTAVCFKRIMPERLFTFLISKYYGI